MMGVSQSNIMNYLKNIGARAYHRRKVQCMSEEHKVKKVQKMLCRNIEVVFQECFIYIFAYSPFRRRKLVKNPSSIFLNVAFF